MVSNFELSDVELFTPYEPLSIEHSTHISYLDSLGRPAITLKYKDMTDKHTDVIYVGSSLWYRLHGILLCDNITG
jgi:oligosaccharyltransferase complex subunit alpha (ribophorin I)